jgi:hypothetical protein
LNPGVQVGSARIRLGVLSNAGMHNANYKHTSLNRRIGSKIYHYRVNLIIASIVIIILQTNHHYLFAQRYLTRYIDNKLISLDFFIFKRDTIDDLIDLRF